MAPGYSTLPADWASAILGRGFDLRSLYANVDAIYGALGSLGMVSPGQRADVFRAFHRTPLTSVRIVIVGEDPYPDPGQAHGLAFSVPSSYSGPRPVSLSRMYGSLRRDLNIEPTGDDLTSWADRGVLLVNVALTHKVGARKPDLQLWWSFTAAVLAVVHDQTRPIAWLAWGDFANNIIDEIPVTNIRHRVFKNAHPRAGRANRETLAQRPPFANVSAFLGSDPMVDWSL
ncbi:uracil-DNA glycosylase family protein [Salinibacterium sp. SWN1162]|uniref:uracil-DNA glycosylase family protein n=1 Tax=Salinibacterium sp. SWN1162 TaxID=2792053 RepID=UPI0018CF91DC|nr:uracil-DNA glycosylase family protein [Salinibacterium sp. SWN1162]MBH0009566.1 hypothetical protein [Salinibacterium sp. SWN1162]